MTEWFAGMDQDLLMTWGLRILYAVFILVIGSFIARQVAKFIARLCAHKISDEALLSFLRSALYALLLVVVVIAALDQLGVNTTSLVAVVGAAGLAVGLALKDSMQNVASGIMLIINHPFKAGDYIEAGGTAGTVEKIGLFTSQLRTPDNREVTVPNGAIISGSIINFSARDTRRIDLVFGISYDDDISRARDVFKKVIEADSRFLEDPEPVIAVAELADSSVNFVIRPWVASDVYWPARFDLIEKLKLACDENGITIPYPQRDVHHYREGGDAGEEQEG